MKIFQIRISTIVSIWLCPVEFTFFLCIERVQASRIFCCCSVCILYMRERAFVCILCCTFCDIIIYFFFLSLHILPSISAFQILFQQLLYFLSWYGYMRVCWYVIWRPACCSVVLNVAGWFAGTRQCAFNWYKLSSYFFVMAKNCKLLSSVDRVDT